MIKCGGILGCKSSFAHMFIMTYVFTLYGLQTASHWVRMNININILLFTSFR